jgi:hypothetical protein
MTENFLDDHLFSNNAFFATARAFNLLSRTSGYFRWSESSASITAADICGDQIGRQLLLLSKFPMHPHHQGLLVVAAIENTDAAAFRQALHATPGSERRWSRVVTLG